MIIEQQTIDTVIASILRRLSKLETGGKPLVGRSGVAGALVSLNAGVEIMSIAATLSWTDPDVTAIPKGNPYFAIYVDNDGDSAYLWPSGASLSSGQKKLEFDWFLDADDFDSNSNRTRVRVRLKNTDSGSHNYYFYVIWAYIQGGSGSS